jgi:hypothetical protein
MGLRAGLDTEARGKILCVCRNRTPVVQSVVRHYTRRSQTVGSDPRGALLVLWEARVVCMRYIFILNEIWTQDKIYILVGTLLG